MEMPQSDNRNYVQLLIDYADLKGLLGLPDKCKITNIFDSEQHDGMLVRVQMGAGDTQFAIPKNGVIVVKHARCTTVRLPIWEEINDQP